MYPLKRQTSIGRSLSPTTAEAPVTIPADAGRGTMFGHSIHLPDVNAPDEAVDRAVVGIDSIRGRNTPRVAAVPARRPTGRGGGAGGIVQGVRTQTARRTGPTAPARPDPSRPVVDRTIARDGRAAGSPSRDGRRLAWIASSSRTGNAAARPSPPAGPPRRRRLPQPTAHLAFRSRPRPPDGAGSRNPARPEQPAAPAPAPAAGGLSAAAAAGGDGPAPAAPAQPAAARRPARADRRHASTNRRASLPQARRAPPPPPSKPRPPRSQPRPAPGQRDPGRSPTPPCPIFMSGPRQNIVIPRRSCDTPKRRCR